MKPSFIRNFATGSLLLAAAYSWAARDTVREPPPSNSPVYGQSAMVLYGSHRGPEALALTPIRASDAALAVRQYVDREAGGNQGWCRLNDPLEGTTLDLQLITVDADRLQPIDAQIFVVPATLANADGTVYAVDFYLRGSTRRNLKVIDATIRAKAGVARYAWVGENGLMRVKPLSSDWPMREELAH